MPQMTRLGVARQTTMMADRAIGAAQDSTVLTGAAQEERAADARLFLQQISIYALYADRRGWGDVARHGQAQYARAAAVMRQAQLD